MENHSVKQSTDGPPKESTITNAVTKIWYRQVTRVNMVTLEVTLKAVAHAHVYYRTASS